MYAELFLMDNALMNMLICRLSAALCARKLHVARAVGFSAAGAVYALCACRFVFLNSLPCKIALCCVMGLALPFKGVKEYAIGLAAMCAAAFIAGGAAFFIVYASGGAAGSGGLRGGITLRIMILTASAAAAMPRVVRRLRQKRIAADGTRELKIRYKGGERVLPAVVDSGNTLFEPVSGLPVAVAYIPDAEAGIPIPAKTVGEAGILYGFRPDGAEFMGRDIDVIIALAKRPVEAALIPPAALPIAIERRRHTC